MNGVACGFSALSGKRPSSYKITAMNPVADSFWEPDHKGSEYNDAVGVLSETERVNKAHVRRAIISA